MESIFIALGCLLVAGIVMYVVGYRNAQRNMVPWAQQDVERIRRQNERLRAEGKRFRQRVAAVNAR